MEIVYHLGVQHTDEDRILKCLLKNQRMLLDQDIAVSVPGRYRNLFRDTLNSLQGRKASIEVQELILDAALDQDEVERVVFSHPQFICAAPKVLGEGLLYPMAGEKAVWLRNIFPDNPVSFCMGLRNPATLIPELFVSTQEADFRSFVAGVDATRLRWSDTVSRIRGAAPECPLTVWCNEDTPILWPEVLHAVSGHSEDTELVGTDDFLAMIMTSEGLSRMQSYLAEHPPQDKDRRCHVVSAFLEKFGITEELEVEIDLPGWTQDLIDQLTEMYEADIDTIASIPGVRLIR